MDLPAGQHSLGQFYRQAADALCGLYPRPEASSMAAILLQERLGIPSYLHITEPATPISPSDLAILEADLQRLMAAEPLQYVLGFAWFYGRRFKVDGNVLIPRPETELLVEQALALLETRMGVGSAGAGSHTPADAGCTSASVCVDTHASSGGGTHAPADAGAAPSPVPSRILDLCTGSGCIAWTLALELERCPGTEVLALDISSEALSLAASQFPGSAVRPRFANSDILRPESFEKASGASEKWDLIVSNPPYIMDSERATMRRNVLEHEPALALFVPDQDPLLFYRAIAQIAAERLSERGCGAVEINEQLPEQTAGLFSAAGLHDVRVIDDLSGKPRLVSFCR